MKKLFVLVQNTNPIGAFADKALMEARIQVLFPKSRYFPDDFVDGVRRCNVIVDDTVVAYYVETDLYE